MLTALGLERIAAHPTNIAEAVLFMAERVNVRHHRRAPVAPGAPPVAAERPADAREGSEE
jgi:hypothetical protein